MARERAEQEVERQVSLRADLEQLRLKPLLELRLLRQGKREEFDGRLRVVSLSGPVQGMDGAKAARDDRVVVRPCTVKRVPGELLCEIVLALDEC